MPSFRCTAGHETQVIAWRETFTVGRSAENDLVVPDKRVSRRHARVRQVGDDYLVEDLGSDNGTFLNRRHEVIRVSTPQRLQPGDVLRVGPMHLSFEIDEPASKPLPSHAVAPSTTDQFDVEPATPTLAISETATGRVVPLIVRAQPEPAATPLDAEPAIPLEAKQRIAALERQVAELQEKLAKRIK
jgi:predicted component of type VI protein secretion system